MSFKIIYPINTNLIGDNLLESIKNFVKLQNDINLTKLIIKDLNNSNYYNTKLKYYVHDSRNKVGINIIPIQTPFGITKIVSNDDYIPPILIDVNNKLPYLPTPNNIPFII